MLRISRRSDSIVMILRIEPKAVPVIFMDGKASDLLQDDRVPSTKKYSSKS